MNEIKCYAFGTGRTSLIHKASREASKYIAEQDGFVGVHIIQNGRQVWIFKTENDAKRARNNATAKGIKCGNVTEVFVEEQYVMKGGAE